MNNADSDLDEVIARTESQNKVWNYLSALSDEYPFLTRLKEIRTKYSIPINGYKDLIIEPPIREKEVVIIPRHLEKTDFNQDVESWVEELGIDPLGWGEIFKYFFVYNQWMFLDSTTQYPTIEIYDLYSEAYDESDPVTPEPLITDVHYQQVRAKHHQVGLAISAYASQREIIDFIKKTYKSKILPLQMQYRNPKVRINKIKKRSVRKYDRDHFIYQCFKDGKSAKDIVPLVHDKFGDLLDYSYIAKLLKNRKRIAEL